MKSDPGIFTGLAFLPAWLDGIGHVEISESVLPALRGKAVASDIGVISYVTITKNLFPYSSSTDKKLVE